MSSAPLFEKYTLTLSRWHHVADRIRAVSESKHNEAFSALSGTALSQPLNETQVKALTTRGTRALGLLQEAREALSCVGAIRIALAKANAEKGISGMLAEADSKRRESKMLAVYAGIDLAVKVPLSDANKALEKLTASKDAYGRSQSLDVALVKTDALDFVADARRELDSQVATLTDQVAELNKATLQIELPAKLAKDVGL